MKKIIFIILLVLVVKVIIPKAVEYGLNKASVQREILLSKLSKEEKHNSALVTKFQNECSDEAIIMRGEKELGMVTYEAHSKNIVEENHDRNEKKTIFAVIDWISPSLQAIEE